MKLDGVFFFLLSISFQATGCFSHIIIAKINVSSERNQCCCNDYHQCLRLKFDQTISKTKINSETGSNAVAKTVIMLGEKLALQWIKLLPKQRSTVRQESVLLQ